MALVGVRRSKSFRLPEKKKNAMRFYSLVMDLGTEAVRQHFNTLVPPSMLNGHLTSHEVNLRQLIKKKVLKKIHENILFPSNTTAKSSDFDLNLLVCLIRNTTSETAPSTGWDNIPNDRDISKGADIARMKYYRNEYLAHKPLQQMSNSDFQTACKSVCCAINRLSKWKLSSKAKERIDLDIGDEEYREISKVYLEILEEHRESRQQVQALRRYITDTWRKEDGIFVETEAYWYALKKCKKHTYVTITGMSGAGKSAMAYHIALQFEKQGYKIFPVTSVKEIKKYHDPAGGQIFILDDPYGLASVDTKKAEDIQTLSPTIDENFLHGNNKVIFTCRRQIVDSSEFQKNKSIVHKKIIDLHSLELKLNKSEKRKMFENHIEKTDIQFDPDDILNADLSNFPLLCKMYGCNKNLQKEGESFFTDPFSAILCDIDKLKEGFSHKYISLLLCAICDGCFDSDDYNERQLETQEGLLYKAINKDRNAIYVNVIDGMDSLVNVYLVKEGSTYRFIHETLYEAVIYHFGKVYQDTMFQYSSYHFIQRYIAIGKSRGDQLQEHECDCLADRHIAEIYKGNFFDVFMNPFFEDNEIYISLIKKLDIQNSNELTRMMLETNTNVDLDRLNSIKNENIWNKRTVLQILLENKNVKAFHWIIALDCSILFFYLFSRMSRLPAYHNDGSASFVHLACFGGNTDIVAKLLQSGNAGNLKDTTGPLETSALHMAVYSQNHEMVKMVFERTVVSLIEVKNGFEATPLFQAAAMGLKSTCEFLLAKGAVVNTFAKGRLSPLWIAAQEGHTDVVKLLLGQKADQNHGDDFGTTPLYIAAEKGQEEVVKILLENKAEVNICDKENTSPVYIASQNGFENIVELLLANKAKPNERDIYGESALYIAARNGHTAIVKKLLDYKATANLCDNDGVSPLNIACHNGNVDAANILLQYKAAVNQLDRQGVSPLYIASQNGHTETVEFLLEHSANVDLRDRHEVSPLYIAAHNENVEIVKVLLRHETNVDQTTDDGATPLYIAAYRGRQDILEMLLNSEANVNICDNNGVSPLYMAAQNGFTDCIKLLLDRGANVNPRVKDDSTTPLYIATQNGHTDAVEILLNYGADVSIPDNEGNMPQTVAAEKSHPSILKLLKNATAICK